VTSYDGSMPPDDGRWYFWSGTAWVVASYDSDDPHAGCYMPHHGPNGYQDCGGRPL
jgi:hypothetical protein